MRQKKCMTLAEAKQHGLNDRTPSNPISPEMLDNIVKYSRPQKIEVSTRDRRRYMLLPRLCHGRCISSSLARMLAQSDRKIDESLDVVRMIRIQARVKLLEKLLLTSAQKTLLKHNQEYWLRENGKPCSDESPGSSEESETGEPHDENVYDFSKEFISAKEKKKLISEDDSLILSSGVD